MRAKVTGSGSITNIASVDDVDQADNDGTDDSSSAKVAVDGTGSLAVTGLAILRSLAWMLMLVVLGFCLVATARRMRRDPEAG